jgi:hypothetical protein
MARVALAGKKVPLPREKVALYGMVVSTVAVTALVVPLWAMAM